MLPAKAQALLGEMFTTLRFGPRVPLRQLYNPPIMSTDLDIIGQILLASLDPRQNKQGTVAPPSLLKPGRLTYVSPQPKQL